ncbi:hypothetical protein EMIT079MI2_100183 [Bacillus sp. IT-79MI2]
MSEVKTLVDKGNILQTEEKIG